MADLGARQDPALAFRFSVRLDDLPVAGFSDCTGLQLETEILDYAEGGMNDVLHKFPTRSKQTNLTLKRGIAGRELWDWYRRLREGFVEFRNGSVLVLDPTGAETVLEWHFSRALPCKWVGPELNAGQSSVAVEALELCHQGLDRRQ